MIPFLADPGRLAGRHVVLQVDDVATIHGWHSRQVKGDTTASILIRALHLICGLLACQIYPRHLPRLSSREGILADHLSRDTTTSVWEEKEVQLVEKPVRSEALSSWLQDPVVDWGLASRILEDVRSHL